MKIYNVYLIVWTKIGWIIMDKHFKHYRGLSVFHFKLRANYDTSPTWITHRDLTRICPYFYRTEDQMIYTETDTAQDGGTKALVLYINQVVGSNTYRMSLKKKKHVKTLDGTYQYHLSMTLSQPPTKLPKRKP